MINELNPSRKTRAIKMGTEKKFSIPLDKEKLNKNIRRQINEFVWSSKYTFKKGLKNQIEKCNQWLAKEDSIGEDELIEDQSIISYRPQVKSEFFKMLRHFREEKIVQYKSIELTPENRVVKLETLPKSYSDYLLDIIIREEIRHEIISFTYEGLIADHIENFYVNILMLNSGRMAVKEWMVEELYFAFQLENYIKKGMPVKHQGMVEEFLRNRVNYTQEILNLEPLLKDIYNPNNEDIVKRIKSFLKTYWQEGVPSYVKFWQEINGGTYNITDHIYNYTCLRDVYVSFTNNLKIYKDNEPRVQYPKERKISKNQPEDIFKELVDGITEQRDIYWFIDADLQQRVYVLELRRIIDSPSVSEVYTKLVHYVDMRSVVPEIKAYELSTKYSSDYHLVNLRVMEFDYSIKCGEDAIIHIDKKIKQLQIKQPTNINARLHHYKTLRENIEHNLELLKTGISLFKGTLNDLQGRRWLGLIGNDLISKENMLNQLIEKAGDSGRKILRPMLDWGETVLDFNKNYKPFIEYTADPIEKDKGYFWEKLPMGYSNKEKECMGHCGNAGRGEEDYLYSLRRKYKDGKYSVHVTLTVQKELGITIECKGRNNAPPIPEYWPYLVELFIRDDLIQCAESGLGHAPDNDFNINQSIDAVYSREKIEKVKPFLFSKKYIVLKKFSNVNLDNDVLGISESSIIESYCLERDSFVNYFVFGGKIPHEKVGQHYNGFIPDQYDYNPMVLKDRTFLKHKDIIVNTLLNELKEKNIIKPIPPNFTTENMYSIDYLLTGLDLEGYKGRELFDSIAESKDHKVKDRELVTIDFGKVWMTEHRFKNLLINFLEDMFKEGFTLFDVVIPSVKDDPKQKIIYREYEWYDFQERFARFLSPESWLTRYVTGDEYYEIDYLTYNESEMWENLEHYDIVERIEDEKLKDYILNTLMIKDEDGHFLDENIDILFGAYKYAMNSLAESEAEDSINSKFHDIISEFIDYDSSTKKFNLVWSNIVQAGIDHEYRNDEDQPLAYDGFFNIITSVFPHKFLRNSDIGSFKNTPQDIINANIEKTKPTKNIVQAQERMCPAMSFIFHFLYHLVNWDDYSEFEPDHDFDLSDRMSYFIELFSSQIYESMPTKDKK